MSPASESDQSPSYSETEANATVSNATKLARAEVTAFVSSSVARATQVALQEVREEGLRWRSILEGLSLTIQGVAENTVTAQGVSLETTLQTLATRVEDLERRIETIGASLLAPHAGTGAPSGEPLPHLNTNSKGILQERCLLNDCSTPSYTIVHTSGTPDSPVFRAHCFVKEHQLTVIGEGRTVRASHQAAALEMLRTLNWPVEFPTSEEREQARMRREQAESMED